MKVPAPRFLWAIRSGVGSRLVTQQILPCGARVPVLCLPKAEIGM